MTCVYFHRHRNAIIILHHLLRRNSLTWITSPNEYVSKIPNDLIILYGLICLPVISFLVVRSFRVYMRLSVNENLPSSLLSSSKVHRDNSRSERRSDSIRSRKETRSPQLKHGNIRGSELFLGTSPGRDDKRNTAFRNHEIPERSRGCLLLKPQEWR